MAEPSTRTVDRALSLLAVICDDGRLTLSEASRAVDLSPSTALRLLRTLETSGFVRRDDDGNYRPGSRIIQLGAQSLSNESLIAQAHPIMEALVEETGESAYLSIEGHRSTALYIHIVEGTHSVRHTSWVGRTIPLDRSAAGHVLTGGTPAEGYVVVERGVEADVTAIAAPIRSERTVVAALSLVVPSYRIDDLGIARQGRALAEAAASLSAGLSKRTISSAGGDA
ncbi:transcriptional regulator [Agromyces badenianii]|uniref:Transcriptional regulator n=1 Tax=Agromyces badenianii TaxID=2080742 RepID=A0A2S0WYR2_9MICO|nr:IclR family transcriptional regulator [Agromyces badenianii]AWB96458.1 transcriptional regulator [Agromyces badenianii]PWC05316.1 IclR family transcriptional regulator [Agromyces badenianii]